MKRFKVRDQFKQYIKRMKRYVGRQDPLKMLAAHPAKLARCRGRGGAVTGSIRSGARRRQCGWWCWWPDTT